MQALRAAQREARKVAEKLKDAKAAQTELREKSKPDERELEEEIDELTKELKEAEAEFKKATTLANKHRGSRWQPGDDQYEAAFKLISSDRQQDFLTKVITHSQDAGGPDGNEIFKYLWSIVAGLFGEIPDGKYEPKEEAVVKPEFKTTETIKQTASDLKEQQDTLADLETVKFPTDPKDSVEKKRQVAFKEISVSSMQKLGAAYGRLKSTPFQSLLPTHLDNVQLRSLCGNKTDNHLGLAFMKLCMDESCPMGYTDAFEEFDPLSKLEAMSETLKTWIGTQYNRDREKGDLVGNDDIEFAYLACIAMMDGLPTVVPTVVPTVEPPAGLSNTTAIAPEPAGGEEEPAGEEGEQTALLSRIEWSETYKPVVDRVAELDASLQGRCTQAALSHNDRRMDKLRGYVDALTGGKQLAEPISKLIVDALPTKRQAHTTLDDITGERSFHKKCLERSSTDLKSLMDMRKDYEKIRKDLKTESSVAQTQVWEHRKYVRGLKKTHSDIVKTLDAAVTMLEDHVKSWLVLYVFIRVKETVEDNTRVNPTWEYLQKLKPLVGGMFSEEITNTENCVQAFVDAYSRAPEDSPNTGYDRPNGGLPSPVPMSPVPFHLGYHEARATARAPLDFFS